MTSVSLHNSIVRSGAIFKVPILSWTGEVPSRFFRALYGVLNDMLYIQPSDCVVLGGTSLGDCSAALRIFGGTSTLTLKTNGIIADFPSIEPDRLQFTNTVIFQGYEALRKEFDELEIRSIEASAGHHLEITDDSKALDVLAVSNQTDIQKRADGIGDVIVEPGMRFRIVSKEGKWTSRITVEKSELVKNGIYLLREIIVSDLSDCESTQQQFDLVERIDRMGVKLVGLDLET